jgi:hypothetical protein
VKVYPLAFAYAEETMQQFRVLAISVVVVASSVVSQGQTKASCTFKLFQVPSGQSNGVTDKGTVVGEAVFKSGPAKGFIRYSDGTVVYFAAPNAAATYFTDRNVHAISIGNYSTNNDPTLRKGFMLNGNIFTSIVEPKAVKGTSVQGINKWNTIVGSYLDGAENQYGFKRSSNGSFVTLNFPGATATLANGINDNGMIVGTYSNPRANIGGGFVFYNGKWVSVNYPGKLSETTQLFAISNAGVMVGTNTQDEPPTAFLYENGLFKVISVPNSFVTQVQGISPDGLIVGYTVLNDNSSSQFTARCK